RRDDVDEQVEAEVEPADHTQRPQDSDDRTKDGDEGQRYTPEEQEGDERADKEAEAVVDVAVALDGISDLQLHHRRAGELHRQPGAFERLLGRLQNAADDRLGPALQDEIALERHDDQRKLAVVGQELAFYDIIRAQRLDDG